MSTHGPFHIYGECFLAEFASDVGTLQNQTATSLIELKIQSPHMIRVRKARYDLLVHGLP